jgi:aspartate/methionine/tyrosine aminotransferase
MRIREFAVEQWMNRYETACRYNLAETCVESLTVNELLDLCGRPQAILEELRGLKLTYGAIEGSARLRDQIAALHTAQRRENIVITHGAAGANALVYETLVEPGDRVVAVRPTYQQHHSIPESYGAELVTLALREDEGYLPDLDALAHLVNAKTKIVVINNPNNPTGSLMDRPTLEAVARIADRVGAYVLCDEVYRGLDQEGDGYTASIADIYPLGISTGSMSKVYALAGLRLGWIVGPVDLLRAVSVHRDYNTISVGVLDDYFAALALEHRGAVLARSHAITRTNLALLDAWISGEPRVSYVKPKSGTTALLKMDVALPSREWCVRLLESEGVLFTPGSAMEMEGHVRIGYANNRAVLETGLARVSAFLTA